MLKRDNILQITLLIVPIRNTLRQTCRECASVRPWVKPDNNGGSIFVNAGHFPDLAQPLLIIIDATAAYL